MDYRSDKNGHQIKRFDGLWDKSVAALGECLKQDGRDPIDVHFHDLRRSAHYQMRKAGIDAQTRRDIMGHESTSMDDRYTMIGDEDLQVAKEKMKALAFRRNSPGSAPQTADLLEEIQALKAKIQQLETGAK